MQVTKKQTKALKRAAKRGFTHLNYTELETLLAVARRNKIVLLTEVSHSHVHDPESDSTRLTVNLPDNFLDELVQKLDLRPAQPANTAPSTADEVRE